MAESHPAAFADNSQTSDFNGPDTSNTNGENHSSTLNAELTSLNVTKPSQQSDQASDAGNDPAEPLTTCLCPQHPLRLARKLSLADLEKLAIQEAPHWKTDEAHACPVCPYKIRTYSEVSPGLRHLWYHAKSELQLRRCPGDECHYTSADGSSIIRHYRRHHGPWTSTVREASKQTQDIRRYRTLLKALSSPKSRAVIVKRQQTLAIVTLDAIERHTAATAQLWEPHTPVSCPVCKRRLLTRRFCAIVLHLLHHVAPGHRLYQCPEETCEYAYNSLALMTRHYKRIHGQWTSRIQKLSRNTVNYSRYLSLVRLGQQLYRQTKKARNNHDNEAVQNFCSAPDARSAPYGVNEGSEARPPAQQDPVYNVDEEHLDALDELALMEDWPTAPSTPANPHVPCPTTAHEPSSTAEIYDVPVPTTSTSLPSDFATTLSRLDPDSETFVIFKTYAVFFESTHATPWWISIDSKHRERSFRDIFQQTTRRQKQNLIIDSCELPQKHCSNIVRILRQHLTVTTLMMPNDPTFLQHPEKQDLIQVVNSFPHTLRKLYNLPHSSMLAREGRTLLGDHEARTIGSSTNNYVDLLFNFRQPEAGRCRLSVAYQNATHLCRDFLPAADYTDLEVRMTTTFTRETLMRLLHTAHRFMATIGTLRTTTLYITHNESSNTTDTVQFEASVEHFRCQWNTLWTWIATSPKPCNICFTYSAPYTKPPPAAIEVYGIPHLSPVTPTIYSNAMTSAHDHNIFSVLDLTAQIPVAAATPTGSPLERELQSAMKCLLDDTLRQQDAATLQLSTSRETEPLQLRTTATTSIPMEPSASTSTATHNTMERPPPSRDEGVATSSSR